LTAASDTVERRPGPGRPSTGARERILDAALETLLDEGYAGLTTAKVAVRSGESKALIAYHFGSKQGLVAAAAHVLGEGITTEVLAGLGTARSVAGIVAGIDRAVQGILDRDERVARSYFDLNAVSVVEDEVRAALRSVKDQWRAVLGELLSKAGVPAARLDTSTVLVLAGFEGLALERLERGETPELGRARRLFVRIAAEAISP
jgi:AcrR family transcriptional regulator